MHHKGCALNPELSPFNKNVTGLINGSSYPGKVRLRPGSKPKHYMFLSVTIWFDYGKRVQEKAIYIKELFTLCLWQWDCFCSVGMKAGHLDNATSDKTLNLMFLLALCLKY